MKFCKYCQTAKPCEAFCRNRTTADGLNERCRACSAAYDKIYTAKNREQRIAYKKQYRAENKAKIAAYNASRKDVQAEYYIENKERLQAYAKLYRQDYEPKMRRKRETSWSERVKYLVKARQNDAKSKNLKFEITAEFMIILMLLQDYKCALTGITFDMNFSGEYRTAAFGPSIDRKDSRKGYELTNVQFVCFMVNMGKSEYPQEMFDQMCVARVEQLNNG